jgi:hypothetical protein
MRSLALAFVSLAACSPDIVSGAYLCGPEGMCPPDDSCDGVTDTCVLASRAEPFTCEDQTERPGDDSPGSATQIPALACVSAPYSAHGCMPAGDAADWFAVSTPPECGAVEVQARIEYPVAYEHLAMQLWDLGTNTMVGGDADCASSIGDPAHVERCIEVPVTPGHDYGIAILPTAEGSCDGHCAYNRYYLTVQLATPG